MNNTIESKPNRKKFLTLIATASLLLPLASVQAADRHASRNKFTVYADVISAEPIYREVAVREPREECWTEEERYVVREGQTTNHSNTRSRSRHNGGDALVGGVIGGVIGNQLGRNGSRGERAGATVAGAIIGSVIANEAGGNESHRRHRRHNNTQRHSQQRQETVYAVRPVSRCRTVINNRYEQRIEGYNVTYEHRGRRFQTRTRKDPGPSIELQVHVEPARTR